MGKYYLAEDPFYSIQGEGLRTGSPTIFIRLAGCNADESFQCWKFCDTKWARVKKGSPQVSAETILGMVQKLPSAWVCITGGEPLTYDLVPLLKILNKAGYFIQVETNGTLEPIDDGLVDHWTVSPKADINEMFWGIANEFKWVVSTIEDIGRIQIPPFYWGQTFLQPNDNNHAAVEVCLEVLKRHPDWRLSLQIHKILGVK